MLRVFAAVPTFCPLMKAVIEVGDIVMA